MTDNLIAPESSCIRPSKAVCPPNLSVREIRQLQAKGKLKDVTATPGNIWRYSMREVLSLQGQVRGDTQNG